MQPLQNCICPTIRIGRETLCLPYAGFFVLNLSLEGTNMAIPKATAKIKNAQGLSQYLHSTQETC